MQPTNWVATLGDFSLLLSMVACAYTVGACVAGARRGSRRLVNSGIYGAYGSAALVSFSSAMMFFAILANDYSLKYVQRHSDASMPWYYKLTSFWGGLDGSIMFWVLLLALFSTIAIYVNRERHRELIPYVTAVLFSVVGFFLFLIIYEKRPFDVFMTVAPTSGQGMNPLLENPYMATHPPSLYLGFVSATVPFAFGLAALITGNLDDSWLASTRRWVIISWYFLSQGLILGALWSYEVLGWGGYWGWDPVENAGFLPWLTSTAFLHSIMVQERRGMLKVWNVCLVIVTFLLTIIGTFMTRSGIVQSVHAFGQDNELAVIFLVFIAVVAVFSFGLVIYRLPLLRGRNELDSWVSREFAFLVNNWILLSAAFFILIATLFPTLSNFFTGQRITVGPPFFSRWMAPIGLTLLFLTGVGPLIAWRKASIENLKSQFALPICGGLVTVGFLSLFPQLRVSSSFMSDRIELPLSLICFGLCAFVLTTITQEFYRGTRVRQSHTGLDFFTSLIGLVARGKRRYGGYLVHLAIVLMFVGFAGNVYKQDKEVTLAQAQSATIGRYSIRFDGLRRVPETGRTVTEADMSVFVGGKLWTEMKPGKMAYRHHEDEPVSEVAIHRAARGDLYIVLNGYDGQVANFKLVINPLVDWIWMGFLLLIMGTAIAFMPDRAYALAGSTKGGKGAAAVALVLMLALFGFGRPAYAQAEAPPGTNQGMRQALDGAFYWPRNDHEKKLFTKIVCQCGTCNRDLLSSCSCGIASSMRHKIQQLLDAGQSDAQVIAYEVATYGADKVLALPTGGAYRWAWLVPYAVLLGAIGVLFTVGRRWSRRGAESRAPEPAASVSDAELGLPKDPLDEEYNDRLEDELDELD